MILGYKPSINGSEPYYFGSHGSGDRKFVRVIAGISTPVLDRVSGAVVILGENYRASGPTSWLGLAATAGSWPLVEAAITQYRKDFKFNCVIVDREEVRMYVCRLPGVNFALNEIPYHSDSAPQWGLTEMGRAYTDEMIREDRLNLESIRDVLDLDPQMAAQALNTAMSWTRDHKAYYAPIRQPERGPRRILGLDGL